jgi:DnaJ-class molecular chaperone
MTDPVACNTWWCAGTQPGTTLVMSKRGVPKLGGQGTRGDHLVHVKVPHTFWHAVPCPRIVDAGSWATRTQPTAHTSRTHVQVRIPKSLTTEERKLVEGLQDLQSAKPAGKGSGWF